MGARTRNQINLLVFNNQGISGKNIKIPLPFLNLKEVIDKHW